METWGVNTTRKKCKCKKFNNKHLRWPYHVNSKKNSKILDFFSTPQISGIYSLDWKKIILEGIALTRKGKFERLITINPTF